jgi:hypothetical protein
MVPLIALPQKSFRATFLADDGTKREPDRAKPK